MNGFARGLVWLAVTVAIVFVIAGILILTR